MARPLSTKAGLTEHDAHPMVLVPSFSGGNLPSLVRSSLKKTVRESNYVGIFT